MPSLNQTCRLSDQQVDTGYHHSVVHLEHLRIGTIQPPSVVQQSLCGSHWYRQKPGQQQGDSSQMHPLAVRHCRTLLTSQCCEDCMCQMAHVGNLCAGCLDVTNADGEVCTAALKGVPLRPSPPPRIHFCVFKLSQFQHTTWMFVSPPEPNGPKWNGS